MTTLPSDDHKGWDMLLAAVLDGDEDVAERANARPSQDEPALERLLDLESLHTPAHTGAGDHATA